MTEYSIAGEKISIPTDVENERYVKTSTASLISQVGGIFDSWYSAQYDCNAVYKNAGNVMEKAIMPIITKGVKMLSDQGVYSIDEKIFIDKYIAGFASDFFDALETMQDRIEEIDDQQRIEKEYRQARKAGRGRVIGGGFGLGGAIKGMATAGVMNSTTGMAHSLGNAVGNMGTSLAASSNKSAVYKNSKAPLREAIIQSAYNVRNGIREALEREANIRCKYVTVTESKQAEAILQNYNQNRIPADQKKKQILQALVLDPYDIDVYEVIWNDYGDKNGDLRKMSTYFGGILEQSIKCMAEKYGNELFSQNCKEYQNAFNKIKVGIRIELKITETLNKLKKYCEEHDIEESMIPTIITCTNLLTEIDKVVRTVKGTTYDTREIAEKVKKDYSKFYQVLDKKDLSQENAVEYVNSTEFATEEFKHILPDIFEKECNLRRIDKIYGNVATILRESFSDATLNTICFDVPGVIGNFQQKENMVRTITMMPSDETPVLFIDRSSNGKTGILFTNTSLRIYAKGIFSNDNQMYPLETITNIECVANDEYSVCMSDGSRINVNLKQKKISVEEQIKIGETLNEIVQLLLNIEHEERVKIFRILYGVSVCQCGTHLLTGEKICPTCNRMLKENGEFIETQICPNCNKLIPIGKKFCMVCGSKLIKYQEEKNIIDVIPNEDSKNEIEESKHEGMNVIIPEAKNDNNDFQNKGGASAENEPIVEYVICSNCGGNIIKGKKFCSVCGKPVQQNINIITQDISNIFCPKCGNKIKSGKKFCTSCGTKIQ